MNATNTDVADFVFLVIQLWQVYAMMNVSNNTDTKLNPVNDWNL